MKVIIAGSRTIKDYKIVEECINQFISKFGNITEVICGEANGVDYLGKVWAQNNNIPVISFPADWNLHGKSAGYKRNRQMGEYAKKHNGGCLCVQENNSKGTQHMIDIAEELNLKRMIITL